VQRLVIFIFRIDVYGQNTPENLFCHQYRFGVLADHDIALAWVAAASIVLAKRQCKRSGIQYPW
jgi:hypothetical protein